MDSARPSEALFSNQPSAGQPSAFQAANDGAAAPVLAAPPDWQALAGAHRSGDQERDFLTLSGGLAVAAIAFAIIAMIAYKTFYSHSVSENTGIFFLGLAFFPYTGGVFLFAYSWERGDIAKALRLTLIVAVISVVALAAFAFILALLSRSKDAAKAATGGSGAGWSLPGYPDNSMLDMGGPIGAVLGLIGTAQHKSRDRAVELQIGCERCGLSYVPVPPKAACPACGWEAVSAA
jgi:hypothetical protein